VSSPPQPQIDRSIDRSLDRSIDRSIDRSLGRCVDRGIAAPAITEPSEPGNPSLPGLASIGALDEERRARLHSTRLFHGLSVERVVAERVARGAGRGACR
jgi:hypothetical protein